MPEREADFVPEVTDHTPADSSFEFVVFPDDEDDDE
jgi:hypothetical protein